jgi:hypothetical protein
MAQEWESKIRNYLGKLEKSNGIFTLINDVPETKFLPKIISKSLALMWIGLFIGPKVLNF